MTTEYSLDEKDLQEIIQYYFMSNKGIAVNKAYFSSVPDDRLSGINHISARVTLK